LPALAEDEVTLFDGSGAAIAYIDIDDDMTIYLWSGKPVAYLESDPAGGFAIYGFNGKHLGWFANSVVWDHAGTAACALKGRLQSVQFEPFKSFKQFKPFKAFKQFAPLRPNFSESFGDIPCNFLLNIGAVS
jgi:4-fold beta-flower domain-containing protein